MRKVIWNSWLNSDMNERYWKYLVNRYSTRDTAFKIFLAIMASGTVAGWGFWEDIPLVWKSLSSISAIIAICSPILNYEKSIEEMAYLSGRWGELRIKYQYLWYQVENSPNAQEIENTFKEFIEIESTLQEKETKLPNDKVLIKKCFDEVKRARKI
jgi:hypothetical protein